MNCHSKARRGEVNRLQRGRHLFIICQRVTRMRVGKLGHRSDIASRYLSRNLLQFAAWHSQLTQALISSGLDVEGMTVGFDSAAIDAEGCDGANLGHCCLEDE